MRRVPGCAPGASGLAPTLPHSAVNVSSSRSEIGLAIVGEHAGVDVVGVAPEERGQMTAQVVSAPLLELLEKRRCPIRLTGRVVDFVGVVEKRAQPNQGVACERAIEPREIGEDRIAGEMVDHVAFAAGRRALDELAVPSEKERVQRPPAGRGRPVEGAVGSDAGRQIQRLTRIAVRHQRASTAGRADTSSARVPAPEGSCWPRPGRQGR